MREGNAAEIVELALNKRELFVHAGDLPATAEAIRDLLAGSGKFFDRGVPVRLVKPADGSLPSALPLTKHNVVIETHRLCQPVQIHPRRGLIGVTLPDRVAQMYLDMTGEWELASLTGVSTAPLLSPDGGVYAAEGYDVKTGLWCCSVPKLLLPERPSRADADAGLRLLRQTFRTFPFADGRRQWDASLRVDVVDLAEAPARDESSFIVALLTAICRQSLWLAPGALITAPEVSGASSGKGLLVRAICMIAFGNRPRAFTAGSERQELEKRLAAELIEAQPVLFLDNVNGTMLRSDLLASILTERPSRVRLLGVSRMVPLNSTAFVVITGNGLTVTEDLARRFILCQLDAGCEDPELRPFAPGFLNEIEQRRVELLTAALTIFRWGRQNGAGLARGKPLGSFETWAEWCRDPCVALGCRDPVDRIEMLKANDPRRQRIVELFRTWSQYHGTAPVSANELAEEVKLMVDPQKRGRQYIATFLARLAGTRAGGFVLNRQDPAGKWSPATYALMNAAPLEESRHGTDRGDRTNERTGEATLAPMGPTGPMPNAPADADVPPGAEAEI
jgi:hypothetical protein